MSGGNQETNGVDTPLKMFINDLRLLKKNGVWEEVEISDIDSLIDSLNRLYLMVGAKHIKSSVVSQIKFLLMDKLNPTSKSGYMLNTIIYGPPGVGKTTFSIILSDIWKALGFLKESKPIKRKRESTLDLDVAILKLVSLRDRKKTPDDAKRDLDEIIGDIRKQREKIINSNLTPSNTKELLIVSRPDFVAEYSGQSGPKTRKLLEASRGKVVLIDEAYSLYNGDRDAFGSESLTEINRFMSENPGESIFIFAGYKSKMENGIFSAQKGLKRRCAWIFEMEPYTAMELSLIFTKQVRDRGWKLDRKLDLDGFFIRNFEMFPNFGGDTYKLVFQVGVQMGIDIFNRTLTNGTNSNNLNKSFNAYPITFRDAPRRKNRKAKESSNIRASTWIKSSLWIVTESVLLEAYDIYKKVSVNSKEKIYSSIYT